MRSSAAVIAALLLALGASQARAQDKADAGSKPPPPSPFVKFMEGLEWGASHEDVIRYFERRYWAEFAQEKKHIPDPIRIEVLRRRTQAKIDGLRSHYVTFDAGSSAYKVSIIEGEFARGTGESVFRVDDRDFQRYYFFIHDKLWKIIIAYSILYAKANPMPEAIVELSKELGKPKEIEKSGDTVSSATWEDEGHRIRLVDQSMFFGTYTLVITDRKTEDRIGELRGQVPGLEAPASDVDGEVDALISGIDSDDDPDDDEDVLQDIVGKQELPQEQQEPEVKEEDFKPILPDERGQRGEDRPKDRQKDTPIIY